MKPSDNILEEYPFDNKALFAETPADDVTQGPCDGCPGCVLKCRYEPLINEDDAFRLIRFLINDIKNLEAEVVRWRQALLKHLDPADAEGLYSDIFSNLASPVALYGFDTYDQFVKFCCDGNDPQEDPEHTDLMLRLRDGVDETSITYL